MPAHTGVTLLDSVMAPSWADSICHERPISASGLFPEDKPPHLVIRVVFAFTSQQNGDLFPTQRKHGLNDLDKFTAFNVW